MEIATELTAVFEQVGNDYIGYIQELPGVNTQGPTIEEARINLKEALTMTLEVRKEIAQEYLKLLYLPLQ